MSNTKRKTDFKNDTLQIIADFVLSLFVGLFFVTILSRIYTYFDNDTYWIIATGREIFKQKALPELNPLTIHENLQFVVHQWLYTVVVTFLYDKIGEWTLSLLTIVLVFCSFCFCYLFSKEFTNKKSISFIVSVSFIFLNLSFFVCRPASFSIPVFLLLSYFLVKGKNNHKWLIPIPILSLLEINVHTSLWFMFPVFFLPFIFPEAIPCITDIKQYIKEYLKNKKFYFITFVISICSGFINPYGITGMLYPVISYGTVNNGIISELKPPRANETYGIMLFLYVICFSFCIYISYKSAKEKNIRYYYPNLNYILLFVGCLFLAILHIRNFWFVSIAAIPFVVTILNKFPLQKCVSKKKIETIIICIIFSVFITTSLCYVLYNNRTDISQPINIPEKIMDYIDENHDENTKIYAGFNLGGYVEFRGYKTYMDARPEIYSKCINKKADIYEEHVKILNGTIDFDDWIKKYQFTDLIVYETALRIYMECNDDYELIMKEENIELFSLKTNK